VVGQAQRDLILAMRGRVSQAEKPGLDRARAAFTIRPCSSHRIARALEEIFGREGFDFSGIETSLNPFQPGNYYEPYHVRTPVAEAILDRITGASLSWQGYCSLARPGNPRPPLRQDTVVESSGINGHGLPGQDLIGTDPRIAD